MRKLSGLHSPGSSSMAYPQGYLYQPSASLALYSCPAYSTSVISGPRTEELGRSSSGSAFAPYAGSTAFSSASPGYNSHLPYSADAAAAATFTSYVVSKLKVIIPSLTSSKSEENNSKKCRASEILGLGRDVRVTEERIYFKSLNGKIQKTSFTEKQPGSLSFVLS